VGDGDSDDDDEVEKDCYSDPECDEGEDKAKILSRLLKTEL